MDKSLEKQILFHTLLSFFQAFSDLENTFHTFPNPVGSLWCISYSLHQSENSIQSNMCAMPCVCVCVCSCSRCRRSSTSWSRPCSSMIWSCAPRLKTSCSSSGKWLTPKHTQKACIYGSLHCRTYSRRLYRSQFSHLPLFLLPYFWYQLTQNVL